MECLDCARLLARCEKLRNEHARAAQALDTQQDGATVREYNRLRSAAAKALVDSRHAESELEEHKRTHARAGHY